MNHLLVLLIVTFGVQLVVGISAALFNGMFLLAVAKTRSLQTPSNIPLVFLSISDLLVGICSVGLLGSVIEYSLLQQEDVAKLHVIIRFSDLAIAFIGLSLCFISLTSIDRYIAICHPFTYLRHATCRFHACASVCVILIYALVIAAICMVKAVAMGFSYQLSLVGISFGTVAPVLIVCNLGILRVLLKQRKEIASVDGHYARLKNDSKRYKIILALVLVFFACNAPFICLYLYHSLSSSDEVSFWIGKVACDFLLQLSSFVNPLVYYFRITSVRGAMKRMMRC